MDRIVPQISFCFSAGYDIQAVSNSLRWSSANRDICWNAWGGTLDIVAKDLHLACEVGAPAHIGLLTDDVLQRAQAQGWGQQGFPLVARILEAMAGVELRAPEVSYAQEYPAEDPRRR